MHGRLRRDMTFTIPAGHVFVGREEKDGTITFVYRLDVKVMTDDVKTIILTTKDGLPLIEGHRYDIVRRMYGGKTRTLRGYTLLSASAGYRSEEVASDITVSKGAAQDLYGYRRTHIYLDNRVVSIQDVTP